MFGSLIQGLENRFEQRARRTHLDVGDRSSEVDFRAGKELVATITNYGFGNGLFLKQYGRFSLQLTGRNRSEDACFATCTRTYPPARERSWFLWQRNELHMTTMGPRGEWSLNGNKVADEERPNRLNTPPTLVGIRVTGLPPMEFHIAPRSPLLLRFEGREMALPLPSLRNLGMPLLKTSSLPHGIQNSRLACLLTLSVMLRALIWFRQTGRRD